MSVLVRFDAELRLLDDEVPPEALNYARLAQAIQDAIGHTGASVIEVTDWEQETA